ncbi:MAG: hypothetical protein EP344_04415 [Bacteroidetes bacterium]|nr:MAG: hypothetical protein EP344_04415 [Bacteroidota bacterium]
MADRTGIVKAKAADPGVAFELDLASALINHNGGTPNGFNGQITVELHVKAYASGDTEHMSSIVFNGPVMEDTHCVVLPYGSRFYPSTAGNQVEVYFKIKVRNDDTGQTTDQFVPGPTAGTFMLINAAVGKFNVDDLVAS